MMGSTCNRRLSVWTAVAAALLFSVSPARATLRYGDIQISGNVQTQNLVRIAEIDRPHPIQQRNTFRLQYEHQLAQGGQFLKSVRLPGIQSINFFLYYRFVYDSIYDIAPGGKLQASDGSTGGKLSQIPDGARRDIAFENVIREVFLDLKLSVLPVSFRLGRQQLNWGEADSFRALDSVNPIDLTWHLQQEAGLLGKAGFDELRVPVWMVKALIDLGTVGPFSNAFIEAYDIPFDFQQSKLAFLPKPFSVSVRNPFRPGLVLDAGTQAGLPPGLLLVQPCFDRSGSPLSNSAAQADFSNTAQTGFCDSKRFPKSRLGQGLFDRHDPTDMNSFGARFGAATDLGVQFTLAYIYRRHYFDIPTAGSAKIRQGRVAGAPLDFLNIGLDTAHTSLDPITRTNTPVLGYIRVPIEFYMPYVHVFGASANYADDYTGAVFRAEMTYTKGFPISDFDDANGIVKKDVMLSMIGFDRPTWIHFLNPRATWLISFQLFTNWIPNHQDSLVGVPNSNLIPRQFRDEPSVDRVKGVEMLSTLIFTTFYKGGSVVPAFLIIPQWSYLPTFSFQAGVEWYLTNNLIFTPALRIYTTPKGRAVDEPYGIGRLGKYDEVQAKLTYQF